MAPLPPVANVIKYSQSWHIQGNLTAETILHFSYTGGPPSTSACQALAADIQAAAVTNLKASMSTVIQLGLGTVLDLNSSSGAEGQGGSVTSGTLATLSNPASTCVVMNHQIARRYRGGKPRSYLPFGTASQVNTLGTWTPAFVTSTTTAWENFITTAIAAASGGTTLAEFVNVSYHSNKAVRPTPVVDPIVASLARQRIGTQRRRNKTA
jgi:hypothetical protein